MVEAAPNKSKGAHSDGLEVRISEVNIYQRPVVRCLSEGFLRGIQYLLVISKVVPKIWARTNSAIAVVQFACEGRVDLYSGCEGAERLILLCAQSQRWSIRLGESLPVWPRTREAYFGGGPMEGLLRVLFECNMEGG